MIKREKNNNLGIGVWSVFDFLFKCSINENGPDVDHSPRHWYIGYNKITVTRKEKEAYAVSGCLLLPHHQLL